MNTTTNTGAVKMTKRAAFIFKGERLLAIEVSSGAIEIYRVEAGGLEMFMGYIQDINICGTIRMRATQALYSGGAEIVRAVQLTLRAAA